MEMLQNPPFKVEQVVESRSFTSGFRGAWFRGKIRDIARRKGHLEYSLEFIDFPDEKIVWTRAFQLPPVNKKKRKEIQRQLMVRPQYPLVCHEKEIPDANSVHEDTVAIVGAWKVGDYVDWWSDGCYWAGKVTKVLDNDKLQVDLLPPPLGEGSSYQVDCKDLRLSLDWSLEFGWSNSMQEREESCPTARLIKPLNLAGTNVPMDLGDGSSDVKANCSDCVSSSNRGDDALAEKTEGGETKEEENRPLNEVSLNSMYSDTLDAALMDLEELLIRIKWLQDMLEWPQPKSRSSWEFVEHRHS